MYAKNADTKIFNCDKKTKSVLSISTFNYYTLLNISYFIIGASENVLRAPKTAEANLEITNIKSALNL